MRVERGYYQERLLIDKPLILVGINRPTLSAGKEGDTIRVTAEDVTIDGLIVRGRWRWRGGRCNIIRYLHCYTQKDTRRTLRLRVYNVDYSLSFLQPISRYRAAAGNQSPDSCIIIGHIAVKNRLMMGNPVA